LQIAIQLQIGYLPVFLGRGNMDDNQPSLVDKRFPPTPTQVRQFMIAYPIIVVGGAGWFRE